MSIIKIALINLSSSICGKTQEMESVKMFIDELNSNPNYEITVADSVFSKNNIRSSSTEKRALELTNFLISGQTDLIINITGGYNSNEILEFIDFDKIKNLQKKLPYFVGYSDITAINLALYKFGVAKIIQGFMAVDYKWNKPGFSELIKYIKKGKIEFNNFKKLENFSGEVFKPDDIQILKGSNEFSGKIIAANLSTFNLMLGTKYLPSFKDTTLFLEYDKEEQNCLPSIQRMLWQIRQNGVFDNLKGLVFGVLEPAVNKEETLEYNLNQILVEVTNGYDFPVITNATFGHIYPNWQLPFGKMIEFKSNKFKLI